MALAPVRLVDCGVDWLTVTAGLPDAGTKLASEAEFLLAQERNRGCFLKPWSSHGYDGLSCGRVVGALRHDGGIVRLSSGLAQEHWRRFYQLSENCSRLDLQSTYEFVDEPAVVINKCYKRALAHKRKNKRGPTVAIFKVAGASATVYVGRRVSDFFGRVYDKYDESGDEHYRSCVRFEMEVKNIAAYHLINEIARQVPDGSTEAEKVLEQTFIQRVVSEYFTRVGLKLESACPEISLLRSAVGRSSSQQSLDWLRDQVAPTVDRLCSYGLATEVVDALCSSGLDTRALLLYALRSGPSGPTETEYEN